MCSDEGTWQCTDIPCLGECKPGAVKPSDDGCNECKCTSDGTWACTDKDCTPECKPGMTKEADDGCNTCKCTDDGQWACTKMLCPEGCEYDGEWYPSTRGEGASLVLVSGDVPPEQLGSPASWRPSVETGGSPGRADELVVEPGLQRIGDLNQDGGLDLSDAVLVLRFLFHFGVELPCETPRGNDLVLDSNSDQRIDLADPVHVLNYLFQGGPLGGLSLECVAVDGCPAACGG